MTHDPMLDGITRWISRMKESDQMMPSPTGPFVLFSDLPALLAKVREDERTKTSAPEEAYSYPPTPVLPTSVAPAGEDYGASDPYVRGFTLGRATGRAESLDAAREAVAALLGKTVPPSDGVTEALAAIDALKGEQP